MFFLHNTKIIVFQQVLIKLQMSLSQNKEKNMACPIILGEIKDQEHSTFLLALFVELSILIHLSYLVNVMSKVTT